MAKDVALVVGAGPGLGMALARRFAEGGFTVAIASRDRARLDASVGKHIHAYGCDAGEVASVAATFDAIARDHGDPSLVVYNASAMARGSVLDLDPAEVQRVWQICCFGAFLVGQQAARRMVAKGKGTILFTGATAALRGGANFAGFAIGKFGQRALAQSMARDLGPKGIHVAHVIVDGLIAAERNQAFQAEHGPDSALDPAAIAEAYWQIHIQPKSAWTQELDLRPWVEKF